MPTLVVVPADVANVIATRRCNYDMFKDIDQVLKYLSAADVADIVIASNDFPFDIDFVTINMEQVLQEQVLVKEEYAEWSKRYQSRYETTLLNTSSELEHVIPVYSLYCVDETLWVAVQQKQHVNEGDPGKLLLKANSEFFDSLIEHVLHTVSFEKVCATPLFKLYLDSL